MFQILSIFGLYEYLTYTFKQWHVSQIKSYVKQRQIAIYKLKIV